MKQLSYILSLIIMLLACNNSAKSVETVKETKVPEFNSDRAYGFVAAQCSYGPRVMNSAAHDSCAQYIVDTFRSFGLDVTVQEGDGKLYDGTSVKMQNIIASYNSGIVPRIIICSHWDSRPWADNDSDVNMHHTPIDGANDGASGVGVMMEIARLIQNDTLNIGIDFICFDAEDCGTPQWEVQDGDNSDTWCLGSQYWANEVIGDSSSCISNYRYGILLDMVGGNECVFQKEQYSLYYAPNVVNKVWATANRLGFGNYFKSEEGGAVTDDHVQVNRTGIRCIDIIASDSKTKMNFPDTWHTMNDNVSNINKQTLKAVGQTLLDVIYKE